MKQYSDSASALFESEHSALFAVVEKRIQLEEQFHLSRNLNKAGMHLVDYAVNFGRLLRVVYRHDLTEALRKEFAWYVHTFSAHEWGQNALSIILDSWIIAIQGLIKQPECNLLADPLQRLRDELPGLFATIAAGSQNDAAPCDPALISAITAGDRQKASQHILANRQSFSTPDRLIVGMLLPAIAEIGKRWQLDQIQIFEEHLATQVIKSILLSLPALLSFSASPTGRTAMVGCAPGDEHELITMALSTYLEVRGWKVKNLGTSLPADQIIAAVAALRPDALFLTFTMLYFLDDLITVLDRLQKDLPNCRVFLGGRGAVLARSLLESKNALVAENFDKGEQMALEALKNA